MFLKRNNIADKPQKKQKSKKYKLIHSNKETLFQMYFHMGYKQNLKKTAEVVLFFGLT